jgi:CHAT domain-containing protein
VSQREDEDDLPRDVVISLLSPTPQVISTLFRGHGARIVTAQKELLPEIKADFVEGFGRHISHQLYPVQHPEPGPFQDIKQAANYILTQFTTSAIKRYLQNPRPGSTILLVIQDELKDIPWELIVETAYTDEIPFRVGRSIASPQQPSGVNPPVRGDGKIKALLIGDPTDDLDEARHEVEDLANRLRQHDRFDEPDVLIGSEECRRATLLSALGSRGYGLIHYSGHSRFDGYRSAWQLANGEKIPTNVLTNSLQMAPPAFVFSSSCESGQGGGGQSVKYEDQTFDLPSAFLQAGVEAYVGTLWQVDAAEARQFVKAFYHAFLSGEHNLGECLRQAKWARKHGGDRINWQAFILYGDPHTKPGELFPALDGQED